MGLAPERSAYVLPLLTTKMVDPFGHGRVTVKVDEVQAVTPAFVTFLWPVAALVHWTVWACFWAAVDADAANGVPTAMPESTNRNTPL